MQGPAEELAEADGEPTGRYRSGHQRDSNSLAKKMDNMAPTNILGRPSKRSTSPPFFFFFSSKPFRAQNKIIKKSHTETKVAGHGC